MSIIRRAINRLAGVVVGVSVTEPLIALTFDDGPNPQGTPALLDLLAAHHAKATFFMIGQNAAQHPDIIEAVNRAGHAIGNHAWDHPRCPWYRTRNAEHSSGVPTAPRDAISKTSNKSLTS